MSLRVPLSSEVRLAVFERDQRRCQKCGTDDRLQVDHIYPYSRGGSDDLDNLQTLCRRCNGSKATRIEDRSIWRRLTLAEQYRGVMRDAGCDCPDYAGTEPYGWHSQGQMVEANYWCSRCGRDWSCRWSLRWIEELALGEVAL